MIFFIIYAGTWTYVIPSTPSHVDADAGDVVIIDDDDDAGSSGGGGAVYGSRVLLLLMAVSEPACLPALLLPPRRWWRCPPRRFLPRLPAGHAVLQPAPALLLVLQPASRRTCPLPRRRPAHHAGQEAELGRTKGRGPCR